MLTGAESHCEMQEDMMIQGRAEVRGQVPLLGVYTGAGPPRHQPQLKADWSWERPPVTYQFKICNWLKRLVPLYELQPILCPHLKKIQEPPPPPYIPISN